MTPEEILQFLPVSESFFTLADGTQYGYEKHSGRRIGFRENGNSWHEIDFNDAPDDFKREAEARAIETKQRRAALVTNDGEQAKEDGAREKALEILEHGSPRDFILETFKTQHIGDIETAEGILIGTANQSIANSKGVQAAVYGESGRGKSHAARAMLHLFPSEYYMIASLSDKALFYLESEKMHEGMTIFSDDARISEGIEDIIKRSTSAFQDETLNLVATKEGGKWTAKELIIPPRINWLLTSVSSQGSEQLVNRQIAFGVDESSEQDEKVMEFELMKALNGLPEFETTDDVLTCREIILNIKEDEKGTERLFNVKIPFADRIEWLDKANRRNLPIFLDMVKGYAVLNFKQRETVDGFLMATEDDFRAAERLYNTRGGFQKLHINDQEKRMLQHIAEAGGELSTPELMEKMKLSGVRVRQIAERLETVLSGFYIEKRSERVTDTSDDSRSTNTQRNYFCYSGAVTVDLFGSVVSLRSTRVGVGEARASEEHEESDLNHLDRTLTSLKGARVKAREGRQELLTSNRYYNNKENRSKESLKVKTENSTDARIFSRDSTLSRNLAHKNADNGLVSQLEGENGSEESLPSELKSEFDLKSDVATHFGNRNLSVDDVLKALVQIKRENGPLEYNVARSVAYTILTGQERYEHLDGTYYKEHFDFLAETHTAIADALRGIISDDIPRMMA